MEKFKDYLGAGYPILWVHTPEETRAITTMVHDLADFEDPPRKGYWWDLGRCWCELSVNADNLYIKSKSEEVKTPTDAIYKFNQLTEGNILFLPDFHVYLNSRNPAVCRMIKNMVLEMKSKAKTIVIVSPVINVPIELEKEITVMDFPLPTVEELSNMAGGIIQGNADIARKVKISKTLMLPGRGLTINEAENAVALSLRKTNNIDKGILEQEKLQSVKKSGLMEIWEPVPVSELGGFDNLKMYIEKRKAGFTDMDKPAPKGIILVGLPGAGKSLSAKVIASVLGYPLIRLDIGALKGSLVGASEQNTKQALSIIDAISPCIVLLDEMEKALGGVQSSSKTDGGTTANMFSQLLTWMQESKQRKYIVGTVNDIADLLIISQGALLRRFDAVFFCDMPSLKEREQILKIMNKRYATSIPQGKAAVMDNWTGAEIEKFVVDSVYDGEDEAFENIKPIYHQNRKHIDEARVWAQQNARLANSPVVEEKKRGSRKIEAHAEPAEP